MSQVKFGDGYIPKFDPFQDENAFKHCAQQNILKQKEAQSMSNPEEVTLATEVKNLALLGEAAIEAINYALAYGGVYDADDAISFLQLWSKGCWPEIAEEFPDFDLNSEAQQALIKESGGMPS